MSKKKPGTTTLNVVDDIEMEIGKSCKLVISEAFRKEYFYNGGCRQIGQKKTIYYFHISGSQNVFATEIHNGKCANWPIDKLLSNLRLGTFDKHGNQKMTPERFLMAFLKYIKHKINQPTRAALVLRIDTLGATKNDLTGNYEWPAIDRFILSFHGQRRANSESRVLREFGRQTITKTAAKRI